MEYHQIDCFKINMKFWKLLAVWPSRDSSRYYHIYCKVFIFIFVIVYDLLFTINFYFLPRQLDIFIDDMILYFTELAIASKCFTLFFMHNKIVKLLSVLESEIFQPDTADGLAIIEKAKRLNKSYWKVVAVSSLIAHCNHIIAPMLVHLLFGSKLELPICNCYFISEEMKQKLIYPLYLYQGIGVHFHMFYNVNIDTFIVGLMILIIAQLEILDGKLRRVTDINVNDEETPKTKKEINFEAVKKINECIKHFDEISRFCDLTQEIFSTSLFIQFSMASSIICVCLFKFTLPAPLEYYLFLIMYILIMIAQIMVPCFFGTRIMEKSSLLSFAVYDCDWTSCSRQFKSNLRLFVERANRPLSIRGGKMFLLSLSTFTSILNSAYSFFTLLQHMQSRQ